MTPAQEAILAGLQGYAADDIREAAGFRAEARRLLGGDPDPEVRDFQLSLDGALYSLELLLAQAAGVSPTVWGAARRSVKETP